ncbi:MAG: helix-turn-helix domain-containing protein [Bacteroidales bacterium]|nr:helix-turn-helix domain-containing protein [Candidatus Equibacterium intestinale]
MRTTGKAASRWIMDRVIEIANNQLFSTSLQICEIAGNMGFATSSDFCKYYRTYTGLTPMQYRKACLKQGTLINID